MWTDPEDLLEEDRALLEENFLRLGKQSPVDQQYWIVSTEAARSLLWITRGNTCGDNVMQGSSSNLSQWWSLRLTLKAVNATVVGTKSSNEVSSSF